MPSYEKKTPMKKVIVIGAAGRSARQAVHRLRTQADVGLTLFVRRAEQISDLATDRMTVVTGDARDQASVTEAVAGHDIVIVALGGADLDHTTAIVVRAAEEANVARIITITAGGIYGELPEPFNTWDHQQLGDLRDVLRRAADVVEQSHLDYTVLRPVWLTDEDDTSLDITTKGDGFRGTETTRASIGALIARIVQHPELHSRASLGIAKPGTDGDRPAAFRS